MAIARPSSAPAWKLGTGTGNSSTSSTKTITATGARRNASTGTYFKSTNTSSSSSSSSSKNYFTSFFQRIYNEIKRRPIQYATIPSIAAFVGISTNYMGVQMLFYPIQYIGTNGPFSFRLLDDYTVFYPQDYSNQNNHNHNHNNHNHNIHHHNIHHHIHNGNGNNNNINNNNIKFTPYGFLGWQGVVPARTEKMALRLVDIVTKDLLSLKQAFSNLNHVTFAKQMVQPVHEAIQRDCGTYWATALKPFLPLILSHVVKQLQEDIEQVLDLESVVLNAFVRDKVVLVELFQKVGHVELDFLVKSGFGFGLLLGLGQMVAWVVKPKMWTLPVAGALVGYITNWIAIKLLFEPADPVDFGPFVLQGLFESRQVEVSDEFAHFMESRVLSSPMLLDALTNQNEEEMFTFLRRQLPWPIPEHILRAAMEAIRTVALNPSEYEDIHSYVSQSLDIEETLSSRLKKLSSKNFEDLLHPVFQEDEIILIVVGGVLGALAGILQTRLGWGGPNARFKAALMLAGSMAASSVFFVLPNADEVMKMMGMDNNYKKIDDDDDGAVEEEEKPVVKVAPKTKIRRQNSLLRTKSMMIKEQRESEN